MQDASTQPHTVATIELGIMPRLLAILRTSDLFLAVNCGSSAIAILFELARQISDADWRPAGATLVMLSILSFACYAGWRHAGVIDARAWRLYWWSHPLMLAIAVGLFTANLRVIQVRGIDILGDVTALSAIFVAVNIAVVTIAGLLCLLFLRHSQVPVLQMSLRTMIEELATRGQLRAHTLSLVPARERTVGSLFLCSALAIGVVGSIHHVDVGWAPTEQLKAMSIPAVAWLIARLLAVRGKRYFSPSATQLVALDHRQPILFLRSFADDRGSPWLGRALIDFSLETRLSNHFQRFGPFLAVGSPEETLPLPGAARVRLADDAWQKHVLDWIDAAQIILMYAGSTKWITWELRQVVQRRRASALILTFPESRAFWPATRKRDMKERLSTVQQAFEGTRWHNALLTLDNVIRLRVLMFRSDGTLTVIRSRARSRDAHHLAVLIAHRLHLGNRAEMAPLRRMAARPYRTAVLTTALVLACIAVARTQIPDYGERVVAPKTEVFYRSPVTHDTAQAVADDLSDHAPQSRGATYQLTWADGRYRLAVVHLNKSANDMLTGRLASTTAASLSQRVLRGEPVEAVLTDRRLHVVQRPDRVTRRDYKLGQLFYTDAVTQEQADAVGHSLEAQKYFNSSRRLSVYLDRPNGAWQLHFVVNANRAFDDAIERAYETIGADVALDALAGATLSVELCDLTLRPIRLLPTSAVVSKGAARVYFASPVTELEALSVLRAMTGEYGQYSLAAYLSKRQDGLQLRTAVKNDFVYSPSIELIWSAIADRVSRAGVVVGPLEVVLMDKEFRDLRALPRAAHVVEGSADLVYLDPVTESDARTVGAVLEKLALFNGRALVFVVRDGAALQLNVVVKDVHDLTPQQQSILELASTRASEAFQHRVGVRVALCDETVRRVVVAPAGLRLNADPDELSFGDTLPPPEAEAIRNAIAPLRIAPVQRAAIHLSGQGDQRTISFIVDAAQVRDDKIRATLNAIARKTFEGPWRGRRAAAQMLNTNLRPWVLVQR